MYIRTILISKLKLEKLFKVRNDEKIDFIFDATYVMKLLNFKLNDNDLSISRRYLKNK